MAERVSTGIQGLDVILKGGLVKGTSLLIKGGPGTGKTLFGLHFLAEGVKKGEKSVYISFDESINEIKRQGRDFNFPVDKIEFVDKFSTFSLLTSDPILWSSDSISEIFDFIDSIDVVAENADRVFIDGVGVLSDVVKEMPLYRRILSTILQRLSSKNVTTMLSAEAYEDPGRSLISYVVSGEIVLERLEKDGKTLRVLKLLKFRGDANAGIHYFDIKSSGIEVYPIISYPPQKIWERELVSTGNKELDKLFGGGIYRGSQLIVCGKTGVGKNKHDPSDASRE